MALAGRYLIQGRLYMPERYTHEHCKCGHRIIFFESMNCAHVNRNMRRPSVCCRKYAHPHQSRMSITLPGMQPLIMLQHQTPVVVQMQLTETVWRM